MRPAGRTDRRIFLTIFAAVTTAVCVGAQTPVRITRAIDWRESGAWLRGDFHVHSRFSDGSRTIEELVAEAARRGCDIVAITDHGDDDLTAATPEYFDAIQKARAAHPTVVVLTGMEWNIPPGKGNEHATVLFPSALEREEILRPFKDRFDDWHKTGENAPLAVEALRSLVPPGRDALAPLVFVNHPSRQPQSTSIPRLTMPGLRAAAPTVLVGFEGAPGHQRREPLGSYKPELKPIDRWDVIAAEVGGTWDGWLRDGLDLWGAFANSDFHLPEEDFWPCEFATTWVQAPERTPDGVIRALRAGSFFAEHGQNVSRADLQAVVQGAARPLIPGEAAEAPSGTPLTVSLNIVPTSRDYLGGESRIDLVEVIGISSEGSRMLHAGPPSANGTIETNTIVPPGGIVIRARGRRNLDDGSGLLFYTNPVRISER